MYLDFLVKIPFVQGKITRRKKKDVVYIAVNLVMKNVLMLELIRKVKKKNFYNFNRICK